MRFCFRLGACWLLSGWALWAGDPGSPGATGVTSVVRTDPHTGKLVRTVVIRNPAGMTAAVDRVAAEHALPPELVHSVIQAESNYNPYAVSPKGARGLMQLVPSTARRFGVADAFNPLENLEGGAKYLRYLLDLYHGDYPLALAAYNAGEQSVAQYKGVPPYPETQKYVAQVALRLQRTPKPKAEEHKDKAAPAAAEGGSHVEEIRLPDGSVRYVSHQPL